jgi:hypothetical protein
MTKFQISTGSRMALTDPSLYELVIGPWDLIGIWALSLGIFRQVMLGEPHRFPLLFNC